MSRPRADFVASVSPGHREEGSLSADASLIPNMSPVQQTTNELPPASEWDTEPVRLSFEQSDNIDPSIHNMVKYADPEFMYWEDLTSIPASPYLSSASYSSTDSGISHSPGKRRDRKKVIQMSYNDLGSVSSENLPDPNLAANLDSEGWEVVDRDEFDGPCQFLPRPSHHVIAMQEQELPPLPMNFVLQEQHSIMEQLNYRLSICAYDFVAKHQVPIPLLGDKRPVEQPHHKIWAEWVHLLKRLATKQRILVQALHNDPPEQFVAILEKSLEMPHAASRHSRPPRDDRNILQLISAGTQVAKTLKDASAIGYLDRLYVSTEKEIQRRSAARDCQTHPSFMGGRMGEPIPDETTSAVVRYEGNSFYNFAAGKVDCGSDASGCQVHPPNSQALITRMKCHAEQGLQLKDINVKPSLESAIESLSALGATKGRYGLDKLPALDNIFD